MKNIQVIDGAQNCAYDIFECSDEAFAVIFPDKEQNIEFIEDFHQRVGEEKAKEILSRIWPKRLEKEHVYGLQGTLFYGLAEKKRFYPTKRESDLDAIRAR